MSEKRRVELDLARQSSKDLEKRLEESQASGLFNVDRDIKALDFKALAKVAKEEVGSVQEQLKEKEVGCSLLFCF